jgi:putative ABC transport system substrate-binding protein
MRRRELVLLLGGTMMTAGRPLHAQQKTMPVIGYLNSGTPNSNAGLSAAFRQGLSDSGYVEGQNVVMEYRLADPYDRLPALAIDLIGRNVDVIATGSLPAARAAQNATSTVPIVFETGTDPVESGLVASFSRPGGNLTGISSMSVELTPKRLELLNALVPKAEFIALLVNPTNPANERVVREAMDAATAKGLQLNILKASTDREIDSAFASLSELKPGALLLASDPLFNLRPEQLAMTAARYSVPMIYAWRTFVAAGGLISYGPSLPAAFQQVGNYVGRILRGAKPADLPVHQSVKFDLAVNLKTANGLGLTIPPDILARADEVIE